MKTRDKSARSVGMRPSVLFDIDEDHDAVRTESPSEVLKNVNHEKHQRASGRTVNSSEDTFNGAFMPSTGYMDDHANNQEEYDHIRQQRLRARSRKQSIVATWSYCGVTFANVTLRVFSSVIIVPGVICSLLWEPTLAVAFLASIVACVCLYEYSWLAFRIHYQLLTTYDWYENAPRDAEEEDEHFQFQSFVSGYTQSASDFTVRIGSERESFTDPVEEAEAAAIESAEAKAPSPLEALDYGESITVLSPLAASCFGGRVWLARLVVAIPMTVIWSFGSMYLHEVLPYPIAVLPQVLVDCPSFFWVVDFVASICALATPNIVFALSLVAQKILFTVFLQNTYNCPLAATSACQVESPFTSLQMFSLGAMCIILLRVASSRGPADLVVSVMLDFIGYCYILGPISLLVSMVDTTDNNEFFANVLLVMLSVVWIGELAGYCCDAVMFHFRLPHVRIVPRYMAITFDLEATLCAVGCGMGTIVLMSDLLDVPGSLPAQLLFAFFGVLLGRFGRLFLSLLKKSAGVRWTSRFLPGFGGILDGMNMLFFTSLVFSKFYLYIAMEMHAIVDKEVGSAAGTSVSFSSLEG